MQSFLISMTITDDEKHASNKSRTVKDDELQVRLGLFLENNNHSQARTKHKQSLNSLGSSNTSPLSTLTNSSEADMSKGSYRDKSQTSRRGCESIGSLLSVSISENSNASSNSMGRRHSITGKCLVTSYGYKIANLIFLKQETKTTSKDSTS